MFPKRAQLKNQGHHSLSYYNRLESILLAAPWEGDLATTIAHNLLTRTALVDPLLVLNGGQNTTSEMATDNKISMASAESKDEGGLGSYPSNSNR